MGTGALSASPRMSILPCSGFAKSWHACWSRKDHSMRLVSATGSAGLRSGLPQLQFLAQPGVHSLCILLSPPHPFLILSFSPLLIVILILPSFSPTQGSQVLLSLCAGYRSHFCLGFPTSLLLPKSQDPGEGQVFCS